MRWIEALQEVSAGRFSGNQSETKIVFTDTADIEYIEKNVNAICADENLEKRLVNHRVR